MMTRSIPVLGPLQKLTLWGVLFLGLLGAHSIARGDSLPLPGAKIVALDQRASEAGPDEGYFAVLRTGSTAESLTVFYSVSGTAEAGIDYQALPGFVTIPSGFASALVVANPIDDSEIEDRETVILTVIDPPGGETYVPCWPARAKVVIEDNDSEANSPPKVRIVDPRNGSVFVGPESIALVARATDEDGFVKSVEFFDGDTSLGVVTYPRPFARAEITDNPELLDEAIARQMSEVEDQQASLWDSENELVFPAPLHDALIQTFRLRWENIEPGEHVLTALATDTDGARTLSEPIVITVEKGPIIPVVNIVAVDPIAAEQGGIGTGVVDEVDVDSTTIDSSRPDVLRPNNAVFVIKRRAADFSRPLHVFYRVLGTADNGADYRKIPNHVTIPAHAHAVRVTIRPIDDELVEGRESVILKLLPHLSEDALRDIPGYYRVGTHDVARAVIIDNDTPSTNVPPRVGLVRPQNGQVFKAGSDISLVANASDPDGYIKSVEFFEGENSLGSIENPLIRPAGDSATQLSAAAEWDIRNLPLYRIGWKAVPPGSYVLAAVATDNHGEQTMSNPVEITVIAGDPGPVVTVVARDPLARESADATDGRDPTATFVVARRGGVIERPLTVYFRLGGEATNGVDYREVAHSVTFEPGEYRTHVVIAPIDDEECEGPESVILQLVPARDTTIDAYQRYRVGDPHRARAVIEDNDTCPDNHPPRVAIVLPFNGMVFQAPVDVPFFALAGDVDGEVKAVSLYANARLIGRAERIGPHERWALYGLEWQDAPAGEYKLTAVAVDGHGAITRSDPVGIEVLAEDDSQVDVVPGSATTIIADGVAVSIATDAVVSSFSGSSTIVDQNGETVELQSDPERTETLANISSRGQVKTGSKKMIAGFVISGTGIKQVLIRAVGPTLTKLGVPGTLADPVLELFAHGSSAPVHINNDWGSQDPVAIRDVSARLGAFTLDDASRDSALLLDLPAGTYTAHLSGVADGTGVGLMEVYDGDDSFGEGPTAHVVNISSRGEVGTGSDVLIAGFVVSGSSPKKVLIRGIGPTLAKLGVSETIADPQLELYAAAEGGQALPFSSNNDWEDYDGLAIAEAGAATGAFSLPSGSKDAAILIWLEPGAYTAIMSGHDGGTGIGLVEVYAVP